MLNAVILGAGAMGCLYASYLCKNPNISLTLLDHRAAKVDEINKNGLLMIENDEEIRFNVPAKVSGHGRHEPVDILLIFVKAHQTYAALKPRPDSFSFSLMHLTNSHFRAPLFGRFFHKPPRKSDRPC